MTTPRTRWTRRRTLQAGTGMALAGWWLPAGAAEAPAAGHRSAMPHQATGIKIGEVSAHEAIVWVRLTRDALRLPDDDKAMKPRTGEKDGTADASLLPGACPAQGGAVRLIHGTDTALANATTTAWVEVIEANDGCHQFALSGLPADTVIHLRVEARAGDGTVSPSVTTGRFRTAPTASADAEITGVVLGCHLYAKRDHAEGYQTYASVADLAPHFVVQTGDNVYYDRDIGPFATTVALARWQWQRMFSLPRHRALLANVASYWEKDDHDLLKNDSWPGATFGDLTFADGQRIFRAQVPSGPLPYRTFRWGRHVQLWLVEGRDFRSRNAMPDGPDKTIWGAEQLAWLQAGMSASDASWHILVSPTPVVGPDRPGKNDNHANDGFRHEGDLVRRWLQQHIGKRVIIINGDRHWQYHSVHPETGLHEFSTGPTSDGLAEGSPGENKEYHRFHLVRGGFLSFTASGTVGASTLVVRHHGVGGAVVHEQRFGV